MMKIHLPPIDSEYMHVQHNVTCTQHINANMFRISCRLNTRGQNPCSDSVQDFPNTRRGILKDGALTLSLHGRNLHQSLREEGALCHGSRELVSNPVDRILHEDRAHALSPGLKHKSRQNSPRSVSPLAETAFKVSHREQAYRLYRTRITGISQS